jgi:hypothetical protein
LPSLHWPGQLIQLIMPRSKLQDTVYQYGGSKFAYCDGVLHMLDADLELECECDGDSGLAAELFGIAKGLMLREAETIEAERKEEKRARQRFNYKRRQLKEQAEKLGLRSWGVLQDGSATAEEYLAMERVLHEAGCLDEVLLPTFEEEISGWVMRNHLGSQHVAVYPHDVPLLLALSRRDPKRLRVIVEMGCTPFGGWRIAKLKAVGAFSTASLLQVRAGENWLKSIEPELANRCDFKVLRMLGRTEERLRWSLIRNLQQDRSQRNTTTVTLNRLDWPIYLAAKVNPAVRFSTFPPVVQWEKLFGVPPQQGLSLTPLDGFKVGVFRKLCPKMKLDPSKYEMGDLGRAQPLYNLVRLFGDEESIRRFVAAKGFKWTAKGMHDAGQFNLSARRGWTPSKWAPLCLRHPEVVRWADEFRKLEAAGVFPKSLSEFRTERLKLGYPNIRPGFEELAGHCLDNGLSGDAFVAYQEFWAQVSMKPAEFLPHVEIRGPEVGLPNGWKFTKLKAADFRGPMLGELTGCCQHLQGAGRASAEHGVTSPFSAFYVVTHEGKVIAQSWAWLNCVEGLVFDSLESRVRVAEDLKPVFRLFEEASKRILKAALGVRGVYVGNTSSGITSHYLAYLRSNRELQFSKQHAPVDHGGYYDGVSHFLVEGKRPKKPRALPDVENYKRVSVDSSMDATFEEFREFMMDDEMRALEWLQDRPELAHEWGVSVEDVLRHNFRLPDLMEA